MRLAAALLVLTAAPALAQVPALTVTNESRRIITSVVVYPVTKDGTPVEDVLASHLDPVPAGGLAEVDLSTGMTRCAPVFVRATLEDGEEVTATTDLCRNTRLIVQD